MDANGKFTAEDVAAMDAVLESIDAGMAACPEGHRCCKVRNESACTDEHCQLASCR